MKPVTIKDREGEITKIKSVAISDSKKNKISVDPGNRLITYYLFKRKIFKWCNKMLFHILFKITMVNIFILYKKFAPPNKKISLKMFILNLAQQLCDKGRDYQNDFSIDNISRLRDKLTNILYHEYHPHLVKKNLVASVKFV